jgi:serine/threonine-protein kinase HipA
VGVLYAQGYRNKEIISFEYDDAWISKKDSRLLDPNLQLFRGRQYPPIDMPAYGMFSDTAPDRWGRFLMRRRESVHARIENRPERVLSESDFMLGVYDPARMGALRFKTEDNGAFLASDVSDSTPPWIRLRELEEAARHIEVDLPTDQEERWLRILFAPGSSLGGARPKASVVDPEGNLWIAKFPSYRDGEDSGAWEACVHRLALDSGLDVPEARMERFSSRGSTFLVKRFDRAPGTQRIHFASAMTLLGKKDGASAADGTSYLKLVEFIRAYGSQPAKDLAELWKRIVFSIAVSNTDDHLRNHGFLLGPSGWRLSPLYDVNPDPQGTGLTLNISEHDNSLDFGLALENAPYFLLREARARSLLAEVLESVARWESAAAGCGISRPSMSRMKRAFRLA